MDKKLYYFLVYLKMETSITINFVALFETLEYFNSKGKPFCTDGVKIGDKQCFLIITSRVFKKGKKIKILDVIYYSESEVNEAINLQKKIQLVVPSIPVFITDFYDIEEMILEDK
jgi:hypothetical protein